MKYLIVIMALVALTACGVDGAPVRPGDDSVPGPARNATVKPEPDKWISGTVSVHTATTL
jgi:predicted small lipoprotein YifL